MPRLLFFSAPGAGLELGVTPERARQLFRDKVIPTVALLNGKTPLVDEPTLEAVKQQRSEQRMVRRAR